MRRCRRGRLFVSETLIVVGSWPRLATNSKVESQSMNPQVTLTTQLERANHTHGSLKETSGGGGKHREAKAVSE